MGATSILRSFTFCQCLQAYRQNGDASKSGRSTVFSALITLRNALPPFRGSLGLASLEWFDVVARRPLWAGEEKARVRFMRYERGEDWRRDERRKTRRAFSKVQSAA